MFAGNILSYLFRQKHGVQMAWKALVCAPADCWWNWGCSQCWYCQFTWSRRWRSSSDKRWVACSDWGLHPSWLCSYCQCRWVRRLLLSLSWISLWCLWKDQEGTCTMESGGKKNLWDTVVQTFPQRPPWGQKKVVIVETCSMYKGLNKSQCTELYRLSAIKSGRCREVAVAEVAIRGGSIVMIRPTKSSKCNQMKCKEDHRN